MKWLCVICTTSDRLQCCGSLVSILSFITCSSPLHLSLITKCYYRSNLIGSLSSRDCLYKKIRISILVARSQINLTPSQSLFGLLQSHYSPSLSSSHGPKCQRKTLTSSRALQSVKYCNPGSLRRCSTFPPRSAHTCLPHSFLLCRLQIPDVYNPLSSSIYILRRSGIVPRTQTEIPSSRQILTLMTPVKVTHFLK